MQKNARKLTKNALGSLVETVDTVDTVDTVETVQTDHLKKFKYCQLKLVDAGASEKKMRMGQHIHIDPVGATQQVVKQKRTPLWIKC